jgi:hypothetical protein
MIFSLVFAKFEFSRHFFQTLEHDDVVVLQVPVFRVVDAFTEMRQRIFEQEP